VNTCARLGDLTKEYDCAVIVSRRAAEAAGVDLGDRKLHQAQVRGRAQTVQFYALKSLADLRASRHVSSGGFAQRGS
jgi:adenylate cyclase